MRILIADDEALNRFLLRHMLEEQGYNECHEAEDGEQAIDLAKSVQPDLVLLDVLMPKKDGYQVATELKAMAVDAYLPIIFITALEDQESLARCLEVGGDDFVAKPFDKIILAAKIRAHSRTRALSKTAQAQNEELRYFRAAVEREHAIIKHIFKNALTVHESVKPLISYRLVPASKFNGDLFLAEPGPSGSIYALLGDFTGYGLASAIGALPVSRAFQSMAHRGMAVSEIARSLNSTLLTLLPDDMFFAAAIVELNANGKQLNVWNGSMPDVVLLSQCGEIKQRIASMHMALGILENDEFDDSVSYVEAQSGDRIFACSDGVIEMHNQQQQMLGSEGLESLLINQAAINVDDIVNHIQRYRGSAKQHDDCTLMMLECKPLMLENPRCSLPDMPFCLSVEYPAELIRSADPVTDIVVMLCSHDSMNSLRSELYTVLSELYNNALEHGLLGLDSSVKESSEGFITYFEQREKGLALLTQGTIKIIAQYTVENAKLELAVSDSGCGFNVDKLDIPKDEDAFGRGLMLVRELADEFEYTQGGRCAKAGFYLH